MNTKAVDAIPQEVQAKFLAAAKTRSLFWLHMFTLCSELGLRNIEARELSPNDVDLVNGTVTLHDSKQVRAYITKQANKAVDAQWLIQGRKWLRQNIDDPMVSLIVRLPTDTAQLANLATEYELLEEFTKARESHYSASIDEARSVAAKTAPKGRSIDISRNKKVINILSKRMAKYADYGYLFPACELNSNRAKGNGFAPVSRQTVYRIVREIRQEVEALGPKFRNALKGIRTGLHSWRKTAVQRVSSTFDLLAASMWVGHSDIAVTTAYLNKSQRRLDEINEKLATMNC